MDSDWFIRATARSEPCYLKEVLALWRVTPQAKTSSGGPARRAEIAAISRKHAGFWQPTNLVYLLDRLSWAAERRIGNAAAGRLLLSVLGTVARSFKARFLTGMYQD
jgi:hypothetical protein